MDCYFNNHSTKTKVHLRSRSLGKRNYKLTKKLQQKMEREQQIPENFYEEFITSDIDEDRQLERKFERYQPNYFEKLNETNILLGSKCKITHYSERPGTGANIPSPQQIKQKQQQATSQNQLLQEQRNTQSLPGASIGSSSVKAKNPKFVVHNDGIKTDFENDYAVNFIEDSLQLEALFYQLSKNDFQRTPITQCSPILAYYLFSIISSYKQNDQINLLEQIFLQKVGIKQLFKEIQTLKSQSLGLANFFSQQEGQDFQLKAVDFIYYQLENLEKIQLNNGRTLNYQIAIDDFIMYQTLFSEKTQPILQQIRENLYGINNLCIGSLRFVFNDTTLSMKFNIRIPIGEFEQHSVIDQSFFKILTQQNLHIFRLNLFTSLDTTTHSEILLFLWIVENYNYFVHELTNKLGDLYRDNQTGSLIYLTEIYVEITSEKRVCQACVNRFCSFPTELISDRIIREIQSTLFTIQVSNQFKLIIASQYLFDPEQPKLEDFRMYPLYCQASDGTNEQFENKEIYYFEIKCVGLMTPVYLEKRYTQSFQSIFTKRIDCIKPLNSFFLSQLMLTSQSSQQQIAQQVQAQGNQNILINADIYTLLTQTISKINWAPQIQFKQNKEGDIMQQKTSLCFQLIKTLIQAPIVHQEMLYLISPEFLQLLLRQLFLNVQDKVIKNFWYYVEDLATLNQIYNKKYEREFESFEENLRKVNISDFGILNMKLLLLDYQFFIFHSSNQSFHIQQVCNQPNLAKNYGLFKINLSLQDSQQSVSQDYLDIQMNIINQHFFLQIIEQLSLRQYKLKGNGTIITKITCLIVTMQQLSKEHKQWMESNLNLDISIEYQYLYFRKLMPLEQDANNNEEQYLVFDTKNLETRYTKANADFQVPMIDMDASLSSQLKYFDYESLQQREKEIQ